MIQKKNERKHDENKEFIKQHKKVKYAGNRTSAMTYQKAKYQEKIS